MTKGLVDFTDKCAHYEASRFQREHELARGLSLAGTMGYEKAGCYSCDGKNTACRLYLILNKNKS